MKTKVLTSIMWGALILSGLPLVAADYFNPADYQYNMTITGSFLIDNIVVSDQDTLFAYAGDTCRGYTSPKYESDKGTWFAYLVVHGHGNAEEITFKYYDETTETLLELKSIVKFEIDKILGSPGQPYVFSDRVLSVMDRFDEGGIIVRQSGDAVIIDLKDQMCLEIVDLSGRIVYGHNLAEGRTEISMNGFKRNVYILRLYNRNSYFSKKILL